MNKLGIYASLACAIHCAAFPFLLVFMPSFAEWLHLDTTMEAALLAGVVLIAGVAMLRAFPAHRKIQPAMIATLGVVFLLTGLLTHTGHHAHDAHEATGIHWNLHTSCMVLGGVCLFLGQFWNARLLSRCPNLMKSPLKTAGE